MENKKSEIKIAVFGDSISEGIGQKKVHYCTPLQNILEQGGVNSTITNYAFTGTTINYVDEIKCDWNKKYNVVIIAYGNVDAMLRPNTECKINLYAHLPWRYRQNGMLNPRPYYSKKWYKNILQHIDSWTRWNLNKVLQKIQGTMVLVNAEMFEDKYRKFVQELSGNSDLIVLCSTVRCSEKYFPHTNESYCEYNDIIRKISLENKKTCYVDLYNLLTHDDFYDDLFHPNIKGYDKIANVLAKEIMKAEKKYNEI